MAGVDVYEQKRRDKKWCKDSFRSVNLIFHSLLFLFYQHCCGIFCSFSGFYFFTSFRFEDESPSNVLIFVGAVISFCCRLCDGTLFHLFATFWWWKWNESKVRLWWGQKSQIRALVSRFLGCNNCSCVEGQKKIHWADAILLNENILLII